MKSTTKTTFSRFETVAETTARVNARGKMHAALSPYTEEDVTLLFENGLFFPLIVWDDTKEPVGVPPKR